ncbi:protein-disulfide reductase [Caballeronia mineralivorans PML1(12)]|uniref:Protein-disulfide reductase n=1 Tax=Caballeronia mineralivorans PML1(12) TaxID=908627 RepID=A0A0J1CJ93_9BURK|nr:protein-disulfide reductase [Caballeronia mineralivorans PML1(12)]
MALALLVAVVPLLAQAVTESDLLPPEQAFPLTVSLSTPQQITLDFGTRSGYYLYRDRFNFSVDGVPVKPVDLPPGEEKDDPTFGKVFVYHGPVSLRLALPRPVTTGVVLSVTSQGCADLGVCYPPFTRTYRVAAAGKVSDITHAPDEARVSNADVSSPANARTLFGMTLPTSAGLSVAELFGFLLAGLLIAGTACMYPLIPIVTAVVLGGEIHGARPHFWYAFALTFAYVQGLALTYALAGSIAAFFGIQLVMFMQRPWILASFGVLMVIFALGMFGVFRLQLPSRWQTGVASWSQRLPGGRILPVFLMGALSALLVGPCSTPALAGALLYISRSGDLLSGALALYVMAIGMGIPLLIIGTFGAQVLPRTGKWMRAAQNTLGVMLLVAALWFAYSLLPSWLLMVLVAVLLVACGMMFRAIDPLPPDVRGNARVGKALGVLLVAAGIAELLGALSGNDDLLQPLKRVSKGTVSVAEIPSRFQPVRTVAELDDALNQAHGQPVMVDFYADWCLSCKELERFTFADTRVAAELAHWKLLRIDVTRNTPEDAALLKRYGLFGPPALIFYDRGGQQQTAAELVGFVGADTFLAHLQRWDH